MFLNLVQRILFFISGLGSISYIFGFLLVLIFPMDGWGVLAIFFIFLLIVILSYIIYLINFYYFQKRMKNKNNGFMQINLKRYKYFHFFISVIHFIFYCGLVCLCFISVTYSYFFDEKIIFDNSIYNYFGEVCLGAILFLMIGIIIFFPLYKIYMSLKLFKD